MALAACGGGESEPVSLVVVTLDTLRADRLGCYGYERPTSPELDRLAADAVLFERAVAPMSTTLPTHVSLFTSTNPGRHGVLGNLKHFKQPLVASEGLPTLAQMLARAGYATAAFVSATPLKADTGIGAGFETFDQPEKAERRARLTVERAVAWLESRPPGPFLLWVHLWDPHSPYQPPIESARLFEADDPRLAAHLRDRGFPEPDSPRVLEMNNAYDAEVHATDAAVGTLLAALRAGGLYERVAIVAVGDHGEGLGQHHWQLHGKLYNEQLLVPLIVRFPGRLGLNGRRHAGLAAVIDVLPTLAAALELPLAEADRARFEGVDLLAPGGGRQSVFSERAHRPGAAWEPGLKYALTARDWKYHYLTEGDHQLYDLDSDPHETRDVLAENPEVAARMRQEIERTVARYAELGHGFEISDEQREERLEELRALGYVD